MIGALYGQYVNLASQKYSLYLASKLFQFAPDEEVKQRLRTTLTAEINKLIMHTYASEVIEYIYTQSTE